MNVFMGNVVVSFKGIKLKRYLITEPNPPPTPTIKHSTVILLASNKLGLIRNCHLISDVMYLLIWILMNYHRDMTLIIIINQAEFT